MATLHVRNVPDELYDLLRERAAANDRSIGAETVQLLHDTLVAGRGSPRPFPVPGFRRRPAGPVGAFTSFTTEARQAVVAAQTEARALGHGHVATEHLLLGVLAQDVPVTRALRDLGLTLDGVRGVLEPGDEQPTGQLRFAPEAKRALELALRESTTRGHTMIAPMHLVLGIAAARAGLGASILRDAEPNETALRKRILGPAGSAPLVASGPVAFQMVESSFRVVPLEGEASDWESQLNETAALGYELVDIVDGRAIFRRSG
jgi:Clp amino terminal domain, pathogenicity island component